ncbi:hypothetical protein AB0F36_26760 [Streptomyces sp. NPDC029080]
MAVALGLSPLPWSHSGTDSNGWMAAHFASVMSDGYQRTRSG